ncbi:hypothetical protein [Streptomyces sp. MMS24-I29]|uniref:hypothetical protein n=1 Tax=Streptomyces sp. MMS24-I29 TaxID=3351480 RepID=UPI003C79C9BF
MTTPTGQPLPDPRTLTWDQANGRACIWCGQLLTTSTIRVGIIHDRLGAHILGAEAWTDPCCTQPPLRPPRKQEAPRSTPGAESR